MDKYSIWHCLDSSKTLKRDQLELVIQKRKINEIFQWFQEHFVTLSHIDYLAKCPIIVLQGPTGSGKTSTLRWISNELKIPIKEYSETTDTTALNYDLAKAFSEQEERNIERRKALKFEHFVVNSIRYNTLYPANELTDDDADSEFDSDDLGLMELISGKPKPPVRDGVIIHIESPLAFVKSQKILMRTLSNLLKIIKEISKTLTRRVAIVFETLEGENELSLPIRFKQLFKIQYFKFNPITKANLRKLVLNFDIDKETAEQVVEDCDGDIRACLNTLQLILCNKSNIYLTNNKKQKLSHIRLNPSLMRDNTRSLNFFHVLGKVFYQKRLYPEFNHPRRNRSIDRPYPLENTTDYLTRQLDVQPGNLMSWLHQHYYRFCGDRDIEKASLFLENQSIVDTISLSSTQSTQFYEMHQHVDNLQSYLALESTTFCLYHDQSGATNKSHQKKTAMNQTIKSSVESTSNGGDLYSFKKPASMSLTKAREAQLALLDKFANKLMKNHSIQHDLSKVLVDYIPYLKLMPKVCQADFKIINILEKLEITSDTDYEQRHERLMELVEEIDQV